MIKLQQSRHEKAAWKQKHLASLHWWGHHFGKYRWHTIQEIQLTEQVEAFKVSVDTKTWHKALSSPIKTTLCLFFHFNWVNTLQWGIMRQGKNSPRLNFNPTQCSHTKHCARYSHKQSSTFLVCNSYVTIVAFVSQCFCLCSHSNRILYPIAAAVLFFFTCVVQWTITQQHNVSTRKIFSRVFNWPTLCLAGWHSIAAKAESCSTLGLACVDTTAVLTDCLY